MQHIADEDESLQQNEELDTTLAWSVYGPSFPHFKQGFRSMTL